MIKKIIFTLIVLCFVIHQSLFLYGLHNGTADHFVQTWESFGIIQSQYSAFMFGNFIWFWAFPLICTGLIVLSLRSSKKRFSVFTVCLALLLDVAIYWSAYAPELLITL